jgi:hypothetical protein
MPEIAIALHAIIYVVLFRPVKGLLSDLFFVPFLTARLNVPIIQVINTSGETHEDMPMSYGRWSDPLRFVQFRNLRDNAGS